MEKYLNKSGLAKVWELIKAKMVGQKTTGKSFLIDANTTVEAEEGAEIFNDYSSNIATGVYSHADGQETQALGNWSKAGGWHSVAIGPYSIAMGDSNTAAGNGAIAVGHGSYANGNVSIATGTGTYANGVYQVVLGKYNIADNNNKYAFIIGNGTSTNARSNALAIDWDGKIYIGDKDGIDVSALLNLSGLTVDNTIIQNSSNPVSSGAVYTAIGDINSILEAIV